MLLLSVELVNIAASSSCKLLLLILLMLMLLLMLILLSDVRWVASIDGWVLTVGLGKVAKLCWVVSLLLRISVAPVFLLLDTLMLTWVAALLLVRRVVTLLLLLGRVEVRLGGGGVVLQQVGGLC